MGILRRLKKRIVGRSRNGSRITVDFLPTELWIKIAQHTADLEQFNLKSRPLPYAQIDSLGHSTPTIRSLCATCRFFFDICLPLRSEVVKCFSILQSMHPKFSILKQSRLSMIRSLTWSLSAEGTELLSLLAGATQLSSVDIQQYGASFTTACEAILSLPNLRRLTLGFSLWIETPVDDIHLQTSSLESLTILRPGGFDDTSINILPFVDVMHRLPHLKELILSAYAIGWVLGQLVSDHSNPLALETLSIEGANSLEAHYLYNFLQRHGSKLRRLSIPQMEATPPAYNAGYLPSLESFFGQARPAISYVTPSVTEIQLNERNYHPKPSMREALRSLNATPASPASLRRLSLSVAFIDCAVLEKLLDEFPNLEALELVNIPARSDDSALDFLGQIPTTFSFRALNKFAMTPPPPFGAYPREALETQVKWQTDLVKSWGHGNSRLDVIVLCYVIWRRHGHHDSDWGWSLLRPGDLFTD